MLPADLPEAWRTMALQQRDLGAEAQARTLESCADTLAVCQDPSSLNNSQPRPRQSPRISRAD